MARRRRHICSNHRARAASCPRSWRCTVIAVSSILAVKRLSACRIHNTR
jgi:hypothetical protein